MLNKYTIDNSELKKDKLAMLCLLFCAAATKLTDSIGQTTGNSTLAHNTK